MSICKIGSYFGKEILLYTPSLKWYLQHGLEIIKFHCAIKYVPKQSFKIFAEEVSDARRAGDVDKAYEIIAENMNLSYLEIAPMVRPSQIKKNSFLLPMVTKMTFKKR